MVVKSWAQPPALQKKNIHILKGYGGKDERKPEHVDCVLETEEKG